MGSAEAQARAGLALLGHIDEKFTEVVDVLEPTGSGKAERAFISRGYDATSHFETTARRAAACPAPQACSAGAQRLLPCSRVWVGTCNSQHSRGEKIVSYHYMLRLHHCLSLPHR